MVCRRAGERARGTASSLAAREIRENLRKYPLREVRMSFGKALSCLGDVFARTRLQASEWQRVAIEGRGADGGIRTRTGQAQRCLCSSLPRGPEIRIGSGQFILPVFSDFS